MCVSHLHGAHWDKNIPYLTDINRLIHSVVLATILNLVSIIIYHRCLDQINYPHTVEEELSFNIPGVQLRFAS